MGSESSTEKYTIKRVCWVTFNQFTSAFKKTVPMYLIQPTKPNLLQLHALLLLWSFLQKNYFGMTWTCLAGESKL